MSAPVVPANPELIRSKLDYSHNFELLSNLHFLISHFGKFTYNIHLNIYDDEVFITKSCGNNFHTPKKPMMDVCSMLTMAYVCLMNL